MSALFFAAPVHAQQLYLGMTSGDASTRSLAVVKTAYEKMGVDVIPKILPTRRSLAEADAGIIDGVVNRIAEIENEHPTLIRIDAPVDSFKVSVITMNPDLTVISLDSIQTLRVGIRKGIRFAEKATKNMLHVTQVPDYDTLFDLLKIGRLDVVLATPHTWEEQRKRPGLETIRLVEPPIATIPLYHYLHVKHRELAPSITRILKKMEEDGESASIKNSLND